MEETQSTGKTKYKILTMWLESRIKDGTYKPGDKLCSENKLCQMFSVSRNTVRHALNELESNGLLDSRRGSGTYVRKNPILLQKAAKNIAVGLTYLDDYIFPNILNGIYKILTQFGYSIILGITYNRPENEAQFLNSCLEKNVEGVLIEASRSAFFSANIPIFEKYAARNIPVVFLNAYYKHLDCNYVIMDDRYGGYLAAMKLLNAGHRNIGGIFKYDDMQGRRRYEGFSTALRQNGVQLNEQRNIIWYTTENIDNIYSGKYDGKLLQRLHGCTAIVCYNDKIAVRAVSILLEHGYKVPDDFSIISFDNSSLSISGDIKLTTLTYDGEKLGEKAAQGLYQIITEKIGKFNYILEPKLIERDSVRNLKTSHKYIR